jgi:hypothetical protein
VSDLRRWLQDRTPAPPDALALSVPAREGDAAELLTEEGTRVLARSLAGEGERRGAYDLLAADALLTYACEAAARADDPEAALLRILQSIG